MCIFFQCCQLHSVYLSLKLIVVPPVLQCHSWHHCISYCYAPPKIHHNGQSIAPYLVGDEKHPLFPCCKHSMKLSHCYFKEIYQFYLYTSSDKSFYVAQMHFCKKSHQLLLEFSVSNYVSEGKYQKRFIKCSATIPTNQSTVSSKLDVECQKRKWLSAFLKSNCNFNFCPSNLFLQ